jgi:hypothetical protein
MEKEEQPLRKTMEQDEQPPRAKKPFRKPRLQIYGQISANTHMTMPGPGADGGSPPTGKTAF